MGWFGGARDGAESALATRRRGAAGRRQPGSRRARLSRGDLGPPPSVEPALLREAFRWSVVRRVTRTASVSLAGNHYSVDVSLIGRRIELRFDPEDLTRLDVFWDGRPVGQAIPFIIGRHVHRQVPQAAPPPPPPHWRRLPGAGPGRA